MFGATICVQTRGEISGREHFRLRIKLAEKNIGVATGQTETRPAIYDVRQPLPHSMPYDDRYKEKVPLLHVFRDAVAAWMVRTTSSLPGRARWFFGSSAPMITAECGVYRGYSLLACAAIARDLGVPIRMFGLDSFAGLPPLSTEDLEFAPARAPYRNDNFFSDVSFEEVQSRCVEGGFGRSVTLVEGYFNETLHTLPEKEYDFVNIDCDLFNPHIDCLEYFYPRTKKGGTIFFDDYHSEDFPMARHAVDQFMRGRPERLFHLRYGTEGVNHTKSFIVKL